VQGRNKRIKEFYWRLWLGDDKEPQDLDVRDIFTGPEVTISAIDVEAFCAVVGNRQEKFNRVRADEVKTQMDYAIVTGWQANNESYLSFRHRWKLTQTRAPIQWLQSDSWV